MCSAFKQEVLPWCRFVCFLLILPLSALRCSSNPSFPDNSLLNLPAEINVGKENMVPGKKAPVIFQDTIDIINAALVKEIYAGNNNQLLWSVNGLLKPEADSLVTLINGARAYGLFPSDYYQQKIVSLKKSIQQNAATATNPADAKLSSFDLLSTAAFIQLVKDLKVGRLLADSVLVKDTTLTAAYFLQQKDSFSTLPIIEFTKRLEPGLHDYQQLKLALQRFLPKANLKRFSIIKTTDSLLLPKLVYLRITEEDSLKLKPVKNPDSTTISKAIVKYQKWKKLKADGQVTPALVSRLNETDLEKFIRIAITLDKYKMLPELPSEYLWVNLPAFYLEVREGDSVRLKSKIICGKPGTQTPQLTSVITDMITYPQWTIPPGIIKKEILPALQRDAGYTRRKGFSLIDSKGNEVNPYSVNWGKYKTGIPYKVVQGSGDANALGVLKFNFSNPYAVYLHDTNQRYLFGKTSRALSHGCVRVQQWKELAYYILKKDKLLDSSRAVPVDSLDKWLAAKKKKYIRVYQQLPLFIRYFSCEGKNGKLVLHEDIYEEDKRTREKLFASK